MPWSDWVSHVMDVCVGSHACLCIHKMNVFTTCVKSCHKSIVKFDEWKSRESRCSLVDLLWFIKQTRCWFRLFGFSRLTFLNAPLAFSNFTSPDLYLVQATESWGRFGGKTGFSKDRVLHLSIINRLVKGLFRWWQLPFKETLKNTHHNFWEPNVFLVYFASRLKPKDI